MPSHCCVPLCTTRGYRDSNVNKISYYTFPSNSQQKDKWIHAIRRDEGPDFEISKTTVVCSKHFRANDFKKTLAGKHLLTHGAVPSVFAWIRTSPRKRKPPKERPFINKATSNHAENTTDGTLEENEVQETDFTIVPRSVDVSTQTDLSAHEARLSEIIAECNRKIGILESTIEDLRLKLLDEHRKYDLLKSKLFTLDSMKAKTSSCSTVAFYTGFQDWDAFTAIYNYLDPGEKGENINYWLSGNTDTSVLAYDDDECDEVSLSKKGRARSLKPAEEYFMVLCRLRQGFHEDHLSHLFNISVATVSRIFVTWMNYMYLKLGTIDIWPSRTTIDLYMPEAFKSKYKSTRVIIDCTEVKCQMPSSLQLNGELFSSYKHHTTLKGLVGISPGGAITFVSQLYSGSISDKEIVTRSGFLDLPFDDKDCVMADKGFTIEDVLPLGVSLNLPPFLGQDSQMSPEDVIKTQEIASLRIHIERAINKIKNFHIWDKVIPLHQFGIVNQMWAVCAILCNAQPNIISV